MVWGHSLDTFIEHIRAQALCQLLNIKISTIILSLTSEFLLWGEENHLNKLSPKIAVRAVGSSPIEAHGSREPGRTERVSPPLPLC